MKALHSPTKCGGGNLNWKKSRWKSETIENKINITRSKNRSSENSKTPKRKREFQTFILPDLTLNQQKNRQGTEG